MDEADFRAAPPPAELLPQGALCVGTEGDVGWRNRQGWTDFGRPGGWTLDWLLFA